MMPTNNITPVFAIGQQFGVDQLISSIETGPPVSPTWHGRNKTGLGNGSPEKNVQGVNQSHIHQKKTVQTARRVPKPVFEVFQPHTPPREGQPRYEPVWESTNREPVDEQETRSRIVTSSPSEIHESDRVGELREQDPYVTPPRRSRRLKRVPPKLSRELQRQSAKQTIADPQKATLDRDTSSYTKYHTHVDPEPTQPGKLVRTRSMWLGRPGMNTTKSISNESRSLRDTAGLVSETKAMHSSEKFMRSPYRGHNSRGRGRHQHNQAHEVGYGATSSSSMSLGGDERELDYARDSDPGGAIIAHEPLGWIQTSHDQRERQPLTMEDYNKSLGRVNRHGRSDDEVRRVADDRLGAFTDYPLDEIQSMSSQSRQALHNQGSTSSQPSVAYRPDRIIMDHGERSFTEQPPHRTSVRNDTASTPTSGVSAGYMPHTGLGLLQQHTNRPRTQQRAPSHVSGPQHMRYNHHH